MQMKLENEEMEELHNPHPTDIVFTSGHDYSHALLPASPSPSASLPQPFKHVTVSPQQDRLLPLSAWPAASLHTNSNVGLTIMLPGVTSSLCFVDLTLPTV